MVAALPRCALALIRLRFFGIKGERRFLGYRLLVDIWNKQWVVCQNGTLEGGLEATGPPPFPHLSPSVPPPYTLHTPSIPFPWPSVCHFVTLLGIQDTRKPVETAWFLR